MGLTVPIKGRRPPVRSNAVGKQVVILVDVPYARGIKIDLRRLPLHRRAWTNDYNALLTLDVRAPKKTNIRLEAVAVQSMVRIILATQQSRGVVPHRTLCYRGATVVVSNLRTNTTGGSPILTTARPTPGRRRI